MTGVGIGRTDERRSELVRRESASRPDVSIRPPADVPPRLWTFLAAVAALIATVMSIPAAATTLDLDSGSVDWEGPSGWQKTLWVIAFCLGTLSMVLAVTSLRVERKRGSRTGRTLANGAIVIALIGSADWHGRVASRPPTVCEQTSGSGPGWIRSASAKSCRQVAGGVTPQSERNAWIDSRRPRHAFHVEVANDSIAR
jgi:hypothetical protein